MAIIQISRITNRYGLQENLPQLAPGEFAWAIDTRRLFMGNGPVSEGSPEPGNTEILTEFNTETILSQFNSYTFKGNSTVTAVTGASELSPIERTLQERLDDYVSVKAFGATGDGDTNDLAAINRAMYELYCHDDTLAAPRILFFPAGQYNIDGGTLKIPTNAHLLGEGKGRTIIKQVGPTEESVAKTADSLQQVYPNLGLNGASMPSNIKVVGISFEHVVSNQDIFQIDQTDTVDLFDCGFKGTWVIGTGGSNGVSGVAITSTSATRSKNIKIRDSKFSAIEYGMYLNDDVDNLEISGNIFDTHYLGLSLGELVTGGGARTRGPYGVRILSNVFDHIDTYGVKVHDGSGNTTNVTTAFNVFKEVGNNNLGDAFASSPIIEFAGFGCTSLSDNFDRQTTDQPKILFTGAKNIGIIPNEQITLGYLTMQMRDSETLLDDQASATSTSLEFDVTEVNSVKIEYKLTRDSTVRTGTMTLSMSTVGAVIDDTYFENSGTGVVFSVNLSGSTATVKYTSTATGFDSTLITSVTTL